MKFTYNNIEYKLILMTLAGSRFYGTYYDSEDPERIHPFNPSYKSDSDYRGVFIAHPDSKLGFSGKIEQIEIKKGKDGKVSEKQKAFIKELNEKLGMNMPDDEDIILYEIKKFLELALDNNPNICDILFTDNEAIVYANKKGRKLLNNKDIFISKKTKFTFSGYALSQLNRIKGHNKWITKYPKTHIVIAELKEAYDNGEIDYNWITDYFGGVVSEFVTGIKQIDANKLGKIKSINWYEFIEKHSIDRKIWESKIPHGVTSEEHKLAETNNLFADEWEHYRKPQLVNYCYPKDLKAHKYDMGENIDDIVSFDTGLSMSIKEFLINEASFRTISKTQYNIFTKPDMKYSGGIFSRNGDLKSNDTEEVGEFCFQLTIDENNYKKDLDNIQKLWEWKCNRNEKRGVLEEHFGYDTKHASHIFRLLIGAKNILETNEYHPRLEGDNLKLVRGILNGEYKYDWVVEESAKMEKELEPLYQASKLPHKPNHKKANELLLKLSRKF